MLHRRTHTAVTEVVLLRAESLHLAADDHLDELICGCVSSRNRTHHVSIAQNGDPLRDLTHFVEVM